MDGDITFGGKYRLEEELANGGCGTVFIGVHTIAGKEVAIKLEPAPQNKNSNSPLRQESKIYKTLMGGAGVPWIMWSGRKGDYNVMVIDLLGPSLEDLFKMCNRHFSLKTVLLLADQLISRIEFIHSHNLVHRDIKPANFVMGLGTAAHMVNVIDFGLAKKFRDPRTSAHIPYKQDGFHGVGTSLFAAINTHLGVESSRRDDLESLAYMLIYFLRGTLPWRKIRAPNTPPPQSSSEPSESQQSPSRSEPLLRTAAARIRPGSTRKPGSPQSQNHNNKPQRHNKHQHYNPISATWDLIRDAKLDAEPSLTVGLPPEFDVLYRYARGLEFDDLPDYEGLRSLFRGLAKRVGIEYDGMYDWTVSSPSSQASSTVSNGAMEGKGAGERKGRRAASDGSSTRGRFCEACRRKREGADVIERVWR